MNGVVYLAALIRFDRACRRGPSRNYGSFPMNDADNVQVEHTKHDEYRPYLARAAPETTGHIRQASKKMLSFWNEVFGLR